LDQGRGRAGLFVREGTIVPVDDTEDAEEESPSSSSWRGESGGREASLAFANALDRSLIVFLGFSWSRRFYVKYQGVCCQHDWGKGRHHVQLPGSFQKHPTEIWALHPLMFHASDLTF